MLWFIDIVDLFILQSGVAYFSISRVRLLESLDCGAIGCNDSLSFLPSDVSRGSNSSSIN